MEDRRLVTVPVAVEFKSLDHTDRAALEQAFNNTFENVTYSTIVCFSEHPPASITVVISAFEAAKWLAVPLSLKFLAKGKELREGIEGWQGIWEKLHPGRARDLAALQELAIKLEGRPVSFHLGLRIGPVDFPSAPAIYLSNGAGEIDDRAALLACSYHLLTGSLKELQHKGATFGPEISVRFRQKSFTLAWRNTNPAASLQAVFGYDGKPIGEIVQEPEPSEEELVKAFREYRASGKHPEPIDSDDFYD